MKIRNKFYWRVLCVREGKRRWESKKDLHMKIVNYLQGRQLKKQTREWQASEKKKGRKKIIVLHQVVVWRIEWRYFRVFKGYIDICNLFKLHHRWDDQLSSSSVSCRKYAKCSLFTVSDDDMTSKHCWRLVYADEGYMMMMMMVTMIRQINHRSHHRRRKNRHLFQVEQLESSVDLYCK